MKLRGCLLAMGALGIAVSCSGTDRDFGSGANDGGSGADPDEMVESGVVAGAGAVGGDRAVADGGARTAGGGAEGGPVIGLGEHCAESGKLACAGPAQKLTLLCKAGAWTDNVTCKTNENCDQSSGVCAPILPDCEDKLGGELYCGAANTVYACGPDLVSTEAVEECGGDCVPSVASAGCAACGDGVVQADDEECDDNNGLAGDGCSDTCTVEPVQIVPVGDVMCALGGNGQIRCFQAGTTDWDYISVPLKKGETAAAIAGGSSHLCAHLVGGSVRCWGNNDFGQLGVGDQAPRPLAATSTNADLGVGAIAISVAAGATYSCAVLEDGNTKCWGSNQSNKLGFPKDTNNPAIGDAPGEMGASMVPVPQVAGRPAASVVGGDHSPCYVRADSTVFCWGTSLSWDRTADLNLNLGGTFEVSQLSLGWDHACGILTDDSLKCWGANGLGQLGQDDNTPRVTSATMGDALLPVSLGTGKTASFVAAGSRFTCVVLNDGSVKCWGYNEDGRLGNGKVAPVGAAPGDMSALQSLQLGKGRKAKQLALGESTYCILLQDGAITCWGSVNTPAPIRLGDQPNEMGDRLPIVTLEF